MMTAEIYRKAVFERIADLLLLRTAQNPPLGNVKVSKNITVRQRPFTHQSSDPANRLKFEVHSIRMIIQKVSRALSLRRTQ